MYHLSKGFSLIELMVSMGILAALLGIVILAVNPARQFSSANNTKRRSDVSAILSAVGQYSAEHRGSLPTDIPACATPPCTGATYTR